MNNLIMFHGKECPHCRRMIPLVERLEKEEGVSFEKLEVWHNEQNADKMRSFKDVIELKCGGQLRTPTFLKTDTNSVLCGEVPYEKLKAWAFS